MTQNNENIKNLVNKIDDEWLEGGFLNSLRECSLDMNAYVRLEHILNTVKQLDDITSDLIDRSLVRVLWFIPQFAEWQTERLIERGADAETVHSVVSNLRELVGEILGEP